MRLRLDIVSVLIRALVLAAATTVLLGCASKPPESDRPESMRPRLGQIVDADTGQPITGALVLDIFYVWPKRGFGNFPVSKEFRDSAEASSDEHGRFTLRGRSTICLGGPMSFTSSRLGMVRGAFADKPRQGHPDTSKE